MNSSRIFIASLMALFLISFASAIVIDSVWEGNGLDATIQNGESINVDLYLFSTHYPMTFEMKLYNIADNSSVVVASGTASTNTYISLEEILPSHYNSTPGEYELIIKGTDSIETQTQSLFLTVEGEAPDTTAPTITVVSPINETEYDDDTLVFEITTDEACTVSFELNNDDNEITMAEVDTNTYRYTLSELAEGEYVVEFEAEDLAGNEAESVIVEFSIVFDEEDDDDDDDDETIDGGVYTSGLLDFDEDDPEDAAYLNQFEPKTITLSEETETNLSFFQKIWKALVDFFKQLFGLN